MVTVFVFFDSVARIFRSSVSYPLRGPGVSHSALNSVAVSSMQGSGGCLFGPRNSVKTADN